MVVKGFVLSTALILGLAGVSAQAQTSASGVPVTAGARGGATANCSTVDASGIPVNSTDPSCGPFAPGFVTPDTNTPAGEPKTVTAVVRVNSVVERPTAAPFPIDFNVIGNATMVKAKLPRLNACYSAGKYWSNRSNAATSTTCLDHKGDVIAYQECKPKDGDRPMVCSTVLPKEQPGTAIAVIK
jgi:hypothetical protein